jgi:hypothetical protein
MTSERQQLRDYQTAMDEYRKELAEFDRQRKGILYLVLFCALGWLLAFGVMFELFAAPVLR